MTYAQDREYSPGQKRVVVALYFERNRGQRRALSAAQIAEMVGCCKGYVYRLMLDVEGIVCLCKERGIWWRADGSEEDALEYGR